MEAYKEYAFCGPIRGRSERKGAHRENVAIDFDILPANVRIEVEVERQKQVIFPDKESAFWPFSVQNPTLAGTFQRLSEMVCAGYFAAGMAGAQSVRDGIRMGYSRLVPADPVWRQAGGLVLAGLFLQNLAIVAHCVNGLYCCATGGARHP